MNMLHHDIQTHTLSNGLTVVLCRDKGAPVVTVNATYKVGSYNENPNRTGLAHLFEHLMFDNTSTGTPKQYDMLSTRAGGSNNAYTTYDYTCYYINLPSHQLDLGLWLEAERMRMFAITEQALATQRSVVVEEIKQNVENQPYGRWSSLMDQSSFASDCNYSWHVYGSAQHVSAVTMDDARNFFNDHYKPSNAVLTVAGDIEFSDALARVTKHFGDVENGPIAQRNNAFQNNWKKKKQHVTYPDNVPVQALFLSFHLPSMLDNVHLDADLAVSMIGSGRSSALYKKLVTETRLAEQIGAFVDKRADASLLIVAAYANNPQVSLDELTSVTMQTISEFKVDTQHLEKAVNKQRMSLASELQRTGGIADSIAYFTMFHNDPYKVNTLLDDYALRTEASVQSVVSDYLTSENVATRLEFVPKQRS